mmetsp:Transcript_46028/g.53260  ORF Transcript_46028/g.53260 Transcript_46028/m.53260 type:complete len:537 (-) Transcript_46028:232-1842(-)|eukprot:CAMPEP_0176446580 /NCGR_PEP_ID=MMETSP0127-20121128/24415_1 /TAXON_ID=938130 /ORGANISM="Platyophrya macrostoma, Strain WH" /LENGTH=536 /DNA_ID=CAMNT_0017832651 /DNA_START=70 /DNA_END=1680 /DNA_ORIENTATION=+
MNLYNKNPHVLKKIWANKQVSESQTLSQSNPNFSSQQSNKSKSFSLQNNLTEESTLRLDNPAFSQCSKPQQQSNPKQSYSEINGNNRQARPGKAEVYQTPNSAIIVITDVAGSTDEQSGGDSPGSGQGDGDSDGTGQSDGSKGGAPCEGTPQKKLKHDHDHCSPQKFIQSNPCRIPTQSSAFSGNRPSDSRQAFDIESNCSTYDMQTEENPDFSPLMGFAKRSRCEFPIKEEFKLDDESFYPDSTTCSDEDNSYLKEAFEIAGQFEGICVSRRCASDKALLQFKCKLGHSFELNLGELREKWCPRCHKNLQTLQAYAQSHKGKVLNSYFNDRISYQCEKNHTWSISYRNAQKRWCSQCAKEERAAVKQQFKQESQKKQMADAEVQKKLFEEARKNNNTQNLSGNLPSANHLPYKPAPQSSADAKKNLIEYFEKIEANVDRLARKQTAEFLAVKDLSGQCSQEQVLQVYKVTLMPEEILKSYMFNLPLDALKADYRRLVKLVHPDKNSHPQAGIAFQKIHKVYEQAVSKLAARTEKK